MNVNGGAVALGHPIGASGARIIGSLVLELRRRGGGYGCVAICSGGGQGDAVIVHVCDGAPAHPPAASGRRGDQARGRARRRLLRPRPHADRGLLVVPVRPRGLQGGDAHAPRHRPRRLREHRLPPARLDRRRHRRDPRARRRRCSRARACATCSGSPAACSAASSRACTRACSRSPTTHQDAGRPIFICTAAAQEMAELMAIVLTFDGAVGSVAEVIDGVYTGREGGPFNYREGKAQAIRELAEREGIDLSASYAYSRLRVRPADAAARRASCGGQSGQGTGARGARGGVGDHAVRATRAQAARRRGGGAAERRFAVGGRCAA